MRLPALAAGAALALGPAAAFAQDPPAAPSAPAPAPAADAPADSSTPLPPSRVDTIERAHAMVEVGLGALSLPYKQLCLPTQNRCATSDFSLLGSLRYALRWTPRAAAGVGVSLGLNPLAEDADLETSTGTVKRSHSRNYLVFSGHARYYIRHGTSYEIWAGGSAGIIVISDRYELEDKGTAIVNPRSTTLASAGPMAGISFGADWSMSNSWSIGGWTHQMLWLLPKEPATAPTGEQATVSGASYSLEVGLALTYRTRI